MKITIKAEPTFYLKLTLDDAKLLQLLAQRHYDGACRAAGYDGGFIYGWVNWLTPMGEDDKVDEVRAKWSDLDTALKVMEIPGLLAVEQLFRLNELRSSFYRAMALANQELRKIELVSE